MPGALPVLATGGAGGSLEGQKRPGRSGAEGLALWRGATANSSPSALPDFLRTGGKAIGWGFELQEPRVVAGFALLMFAVGLNLSGVFEWTRGIERAKS